jgi:hypothetical protein
VTPEQKFVKTLFTKAGHNVRYPRGYWSHMHERVEVDAAHIRIIDTHPDQPGAVLVEIEFDEHGPRNAAFRSAVYPFLDRKLIWRVLYRATKELLRSRTEAA